MNRVRAMETKQAANNYRPMHKYPAASKYRRIKVAVLLGLLGLLLALNTLGVSAGMIWAG